MKKQSKSSVSKTVGVVASVAVLSAAAYVLFGPNGKKNRKVIKGWMVKMKGEIIEKFETVKELTEPVYHKIINEVSAKYAKLKHVDPSELKSTVSEMARHWKAMSGTKTKKSVKKSAKKVAKKAVKKVSKK